LYKHVTREQGHFYHPLLAIPTADDFAFGQIGPDAFLRQNAFYGMFVPASRAQDQPWIHARFDHVFSFTAAGKNTRIDVGEIPAVLHATSCEWGPLCAITLSDTAALCFPWISSGHTHAQEPLRTLVRRKMPKNRLNDIVAAAIPDGI
jgi:hypothetical protein